MSETAQEAARVRELVEAARVVLWDFDGPVCRLFAGHSAKGVAAGAMRWLEDEGLRGLLTDDERALRDPIVVLRAVDRRHPGSDLVTELEERLTREEALAATTALPTAYADPLIRTWTSVGVRPAVTTNNSPRVVRDYLGRRGLLDCFAPHVYGRTSDLHRLKPDPDCLHRALRAMGAAPSTALMIGDSPSDHEAAESARVPFLGYARNEEKAELLRKSGADVVVSSLETVLQVVRGPLPGR